MSTVRVRHSTRVQAQHQAWERELRHARRTTRLLAIVLAALGVRIVISGATTASTLMAIILAVLLLAAVLLTRYGQIVEPKHHPGDPTRRRPK